MYSRFKQEMQGQYQTIGKNINGSSLSDGANDMLNDIIKVCHLNTISLYDEWRTIQEIICNATREIQEEVREFLATLLNGRSRRDTPDSTEQPEILNAGTVFPPTAWNTLEEQSKQELNTILDNEDLTKQQLIDQIKQWAAKQSAQHQVSSVLPFECYCTGIL